MYILHNYGYIMIHVCIIVAAYNVIISAYFKCCIKVDPVLLYSTSKYVLPLIFSHKKTQNSKMN